MWNWYSRSPSPAVITRNYGWSGGESAGKNIQKNSWTSTLKCISTDLALVENSHWTCSQSVTALQELFKRDGEILPLRQDSGIVFWVSISSYSTILTTIPLFNSFLKCFPFLFTLVPKTTANPRHLMIITLCSSQRLATIPYWWTPVFPTCCFDRSCSIPVLPFLCQLHAVPRAACASILAHSCPPRTSSIVRHHHV